MIRAFAAIAMAFALSACVSLGGGKPPASLLTLTAAESPAADQGRAIASKDAMTVTVPLVPQAIATNRVAVSDGATAVAYVKDAYWVEPPARLFQRLLAETLTAKTGRLVLDPRQFGNAAGSTLSGRLVSFGVNVTTTGADSGTAVVVYDAVFSRDRGANVAARRFEARIPVGPIDAAQSGRTLNRAANEVATQVAAWVGSL